MPQREGDAKATPPKRSIPHPDDDKPTAAKPTESKPVEAKTAAQAPAEPAPKEVAIGGDFDKAAAGAALDGAATEASGCRKEGGRFAS